MPDLKVFVPLGGGIGLSSEDVRRFWSHVDIRGEDECWPWRLSTYHNGYGQFEAQDKPLRANRVAYELTRGALEEGQYALHTCDYPPCCNPKHLFAGTAVDNSRDMAAKGRVKGGARSLDANHNCRLSSLDVRKARHLREVQGLTHRKIAEQFGVDRSTITAALSGKNWKTLDAGS